MHAQLHLRSTRQRRATARWLGAFTVVSLLALSVPTAPATAATRPAPAKLEDRALLVNQSNRFVVLPPGKSATVWFDFLNTGASTWTRDDPHPVSLNTDQPMRRTSMFEYRYWRASWRPARVQQPTVKPGATGRFRFAIRAPNKPGVWIERFAVVRDRDTPIPGGEVELVVVIGQTGDPATVYRALPKQRELAFTVRPGQRVTQPVEFRNIGYATWRTVGFAPTQLVHVAIEGMAIASDSLIATVQPIARAAARAKTTTSQLDFVAPQTPGTYTETFGLNGPYGLIQGSAITVRLTVTTDRLPILTAEPRVRVGVYAPAKPVEMTADGPYGIWNADTNQLIDSFPAGAVSTVTYDAAAGTYLLTTPNGSTTVAAPVRFVPSGPDVILEIKSFSNRVSETVNDNRFRDVIEVRYAPATGKTWVINELPIERYLRGLAETSNAAPPEFQKTLVVAARTYALYKVFDGMKHDPEAYDINSTTDQLYRGYGYELRTPNITAAVEATRGLTVSHPSMVSDTNLVGAIVAAYSSCTDGRTRSYEERWGGTPGRYPYLVSVPDPLGVCTSPPYPTSYLSGGDGNHMVGLSAYGALNTIQRLGTSFEAILPAYYTGSVIVLAYR